MLDARQAANSTRRMVAVAATITSVSYLLVDRLLLGFHVEVWLDEVITTSAVAVLAGVALWLTVIRPLRREADAEREASARREAQLLLTAQRQEFESALHRAVEMAATEEAVYRATAKAIERGTRHPDAELLLADSSEAHLKRAVALGGDGRHARCFVITPRDCPAIRRAQTLTFSSSENLDACPHLESRDTGPCAAVCVPVSVGGRSIGVLHASACFA